MWYASKKRGCFFILIVIFLSVTVNEVSAQVRINEIMADNLNTIADPEKGNYGDWIELYNSGSASVSLTGYSLSDDIENLGRWLFPDGSKISGNGFLLIWADNDDAGYHTNFRLNKGGEIIILSDPGLVVLDSITFIEQIEDVSYGRLNDGGSEWVFFSKPSPGTSNTGGSTELVAAPPVFSLSSGFYDGQQTLELRAQSEDANIYYTLDGSLPSQSSTKFQNPVILNKTGVIRAIQLQVGYLPSPVVTKTFLIDEPTTLPVFSIVTDPVNLWDDDTGIYVEGTGYTWGWGHGNFWQNWEKPCFVEFWEDNRKQKIAQAAGLKIHGALTRTASQKSLRIIARSEYGKTKFSYRFFKDKNISSFNEIVLRSSGNDWARTMMADGLMNTIVAGQMDIDYDAFRPAILFLNGEYWGIHNIREKIGDDYIEENHGFDKDNLDLLSQIDDIREGDRIAYNELLNFVKQNSMADEANYSFAKSRMDIQEYINYYVAQVFFANHDWPAGNIKYWRTRTEFGKWRWILFDTDLAYQKPYLNTLLWASDPSIHYPGTTDIFNGLLDNDGFRKQFLNTFQYHMATTFKEERLIGIIDSLQAFIEPEIQRHIDRWIGKHGWTHTNADGVYDETTWLKSYQDWANNVDGFRQFSKNRANFLNTFVSEFYEYGGSFELLLDIDPPRSGKIWINEDIAYAEPIELVLFKDQPLSIQPVNNIDTEFSNWLLNRNYYDEGAVVEFVSKNSTWKYLDTGQYPQTNWVSKDFNDSEWKMGLGILGYNNDNILTVLNYGTDDSKKYISYLFRHKFDIVSRADWSEIIVHLLRDDGAVVYLNGQEIIRTNMPADSDFNSLATTGTDAIDENKYFDFNIPTNYLVSGTNTIAVEVHQVSASSSDLSFDLSLIGMAGTSSEIGETIYDEIVTNSFDSRTKLTASFSLLSEPLLLKINEVMSVNAGAFLTNAGQSPDWVEIYNPNDRVVDIGGLFITDNLLNPGKWQIPTNDPKITSIQPKSFLVLLADQKVSLGVEHIDLRLSRLGEEMAIYHQTGDSFVLIDSIFFPALQENTSFGRYPDGDDKWVIFTISSTPGQSNKILEDIIPDVPIYLFASYPNPFIHSTTIRFYLKEEALVQVLVRDLQGKIVKILADGLYGPGLQVVMWNGKDDQNKDVPPGMYFYTIYSTFYSDTYRTIRLR